MRKFLGIAAAATILAASAPATAATVFGIDLSGRLVTFDSASPSTITSTRALSGVVGSAILGIDFRPSTGELFALGGNSQLYTINTTTGAATAVGTGGLPLSGSNFGFGFNPTVDRIRLVSDSGQNLRLNPITGGVAATDGAYLYADGSQSNITAVGYTNSVVNATSTTLYGIDFTRDTLTLMGSPNGGLVTTVGLLGFDIDADASFDIDANGQGFLSSGFNFYTVNLTTGAAARVGGTDGLRNIAVAQPAVAAVPEPATWAMLIFGFGMVGSAMRRRRTTVSFG
ncbi:DUF4394 domain-containing protein [Sphingomonas sp. RS2018]